MNELFVRMIVPALSILDTYWTYRRVVLYKKINVDATKLELNGLTKYLWSKLGLKVGSLFGGIVSLAIILTLCSLFSLYFVCFVVGILTITNLLHLTDLSQLKALIKQREISLEDIFEEVKKDKIKKKGVEKGLLKKNKGNNKEPDYLGV